MADAPTRDEWLQALEEAGVRASVSDPSAITIQEYAALLHVPIPTARHQLLTLVKAGKAVETRKRQVSSYGRLLDYKAYRLVR